MKALHTIFFLVSIALLGSCKGPNSKGTTAATAPILHKDYQLYKAAANKATLVLFPGGGTDAAYTKQEFAIVDLANAQGISVLLLNFSRHIWVDSLKAKDLSLQLADIFKEQQLNTQNVTIGGMSIGGNVGLAVGNYLAANGSAIAPKQLFVVDAPIDLYALYQSALADIKNPAFDEERLAEPRFIINYFEEEFTKDSLLNNLKKVSPFVRLAEHSSVPALAKTKLRFYTEPDAAWWQQNRQTSFEHTNAYTIQEVYKIFRRKNWNKLELISTKNKGYRSNGERHPHSWSIVDAQDLVDWIME